MCRLPHGTVLAMLMCRSVLAASMYAYHVHSWYLRSEDGFGFPGNEARDVCEEPCGCWELNSSPPEEQPVPLDKAVFSLQMAVLLSGTD